MSSTEPFFLCPFPEYATRVFAAFTTRHARGFSSGAYADLNLGYRSGDDPDKVSQNWNKVLMEAGLLGKTLVLPRLVHGDSLFDAGTVLDSMPHDLVPYTSTEADAVYATASGCALAVTMADCLTALIYDPVSATIAAVHAGWRGTRAKILEKTLRHLSQTRGINLEKTLVAFGPCLQRDSLEVGAEIAASLSIEFVFRKEGRFYFDMQGDNHAQAVSVGISPHNIRKMGGCTLREPERYFSYRRDGQASGRQAAFISLR